MLSSLFGAPKKKSAANDAVDREVQSALYNQYLESRQKLAAPYTASKNFNAMNLFNKKSVNKAAAKRQNDMNKAAADEECALLGNGISTIQRILYNDSDVEYYFTMYGRIENLLFPKIRTQLQTVSVTKYTKPCRDEFTDAFKMLVEKHPEVESYFKLSPDAAMGMQRAAFAEAERKAQMLRESPQQYAYLYGTGGAKKRKTRKSKARKAKHTRRH